MLKRFATALIALSLLSACIDAPASADVAPAAGLEQALSGKRLELRAVGGDQPDIVMELAEGGIGAAEAWMNGDPLWAAGMRWKVENGKFCTQLLKRGASPEFECLTVAIDGQSIKMTYDQSTGGQEVFTGTLRPL